jgi:hypothetical protein
MMRNLGRSDVDPRLPVGVRCKERTNSQTQWMTLRRVIQRSAQIRTAQSMCCRFRSRVGRLDEPKCAGEQEPGWVR